MHNFRDKFVFVGGFFLIGIAMILTSAFLNGENPLTIHAFSQLGVRQAQEDFFIQEVNVREAISPEVFNIAIFIIGLSYIALYYMILTNWDYKKNRGIESAAIFGILNGISIIAIAILDLGTFPELHIIAVGFMMFFSVLQLLSWLYGTKDSKTPFHDDYQLIMIIVVLWVLLFLGVMFGFTSYWRSVLLKMAYTSHLIYTLFVPIRLIFD